MRQSRPLSIEEKDLGCSEYPHDILIRPIATEENTGPSYNTSTTTNSQNVTPINKDLITINPNPVSNQLNITIYSRSKVNLMIDIFDLTGGRIGTISEKTILPGKVTLSKDIEDLPAGLYTIRAIYRDLQGSVERIQTIKFIKSI